MKYDVNYIRSQFPALSLKVEGYPAAFLDGPGGTQVPQRVLDTMMEYMIKQNSNIEGAFITSIETDRIILEARKALADFLGCNWEEVAFGENTTTLLYKLALAIARDLKRGDEIIITEIDHEANRGPWESLEEKGVVIKEVKVDTQNCVLDMKDYESKLSEKTRVVALNYASNAVGTINDVKTMIKMAHDVGAITVVDAVHYASHCPVDVKEIDTDFLACSVYKFFGPHLGVLYGKKQVFEKVRTYKVRPQYDKIPDKIETGTTNHEGIAGALAAVEFIAEVGEKFGKNYKGNTNVSQRRKNIVMGMEAIDQYEKPIAQHLIQELLKIRGVKVYGPPEDYPRTSTVSFVVENINSREVAKALGKKGLFVWDGDFFATKLVERLGLVDQGGLVRVGLAPYNTKEEIDRLIYELKNIIQKS